MGDRVRAGLVAVSIAALATAAPACAETLGDAIAMAYQTNPTLAAARINLRYLEESYVQALAQLRPNASVGVQVQDERLGHRQNPNYATITDPAEEADTSTALLQFSQPIYTGGRATAGIRAAEADILSERETVRQSEADVMAQVISSYVNVRRDQQAIAIGQENVGDLTRQVAESRTRFAAGEVTRTDVAQSEADLAAAQASLAQAQAQLAIDRATFVQVVGETPTDLDPEPALRLPADLDAAFDRAEQYNPNIRSLNYSIQGAEARVEEAKAGRRPTISVSGGVGFESLPSFPIERPNYYNYSIVTGTLTQPLFSGGAVSSAIRQALERENYYTVQLEGARRSTVQNLSQGWNQLLAARASIAANEERVRAARVAVEGAQAEQAVGLRTTLEVLSVEQTLRDAQLDLVNARRDEYVASASVLNATGELAAANLVAGLPQEPAGHSFHQLSQAPGFVPWEQAVQAIDALTGAPKIHELPPPPDEPLITASPGGGADVGSHGPAGKVETTPAAIAIGPTPKPSAASPGPGL